MGYSFQLAARVLLYESSHRQDNHTTVFVTPVVEHWLEREIAQLVRVKVSVKDRVRVGMVFRVTVWFYLSIQWRVMGRNLSVLFKE